MIYNKVGETLEFEGKKYAVGENIVGAETSEYEGLFGYIKEIRTDNDKDTENDPPDIYCEFFPPVYPDEIKKVEERFSALYGERKTLNDIALDEVIMAPEMITPLSVIYGQTNTSVFIVKEQWAVDDEYGEQTNGFLKLENAQLFMRQRLSEASVNVGIFALRGEDYIVESYSDMFYEIYQEGFYNENHYCIGIDKVDIPDAKLMLAKDKEP